MPADPGVKHDSGKPRWDLLPFSAVNELAKVLEFGARKYSPDGWRRVEGLKARYIAAGLRHVAAFATGEELDKESGLHHLAHALCCFAFVLEDALLPVAQPLDLGALKGGWKVSLGGLVGFDPKCPNCTYKGPCDVCRDKTLGHDLK